MRLNDQALCERLRALEEFLDELRWMPLGVVAAELPPEREDDARATSLRRADHLIREFHLELQAEAAAIDVEKLVFSRWHFRRRRVTPNDFAPRRRFIRAASAYASALLVRPELTSAELRAIALPV